MDGTIVNTGVMIAKTINHVRYHMGLEPMEQNQLLRDLNDPKINSASHFYGTKHFSEQQTKLFEDYYQKNCIIGVELYDGMKKLLQECSKRYTLTIATNAHTDFANKILTHLEVNSYFEMIVGADMVQNPKPHPEMIEKTLKKLNYKKNDSILIGDSLKDKQAAHSAGINFKLVNWGFTQYDEDENVISDIKKLKEILIT